MKNAFTSPKILLVKGSLEYERVEGKFSSIDPILAQEFEYLRGVVFKIVNWQPDILIVEKTVARIARTLLRWRLKHQNLLFLVKNLVKVRHVSERPI